MLARAEVVLENYLSPKLAVVGDLLPIHLTLTDTRYMSIDKLKDGILMIFKQS